MHRAQRILQAFIYLLAFAGLMGILHAAWSFAPQKPQTANILHTVRTSPGDLEVGGELAGLPSGSIRYVRYDDLLKLPQESYTIHGDDNFGNGKQTVQVGGIALSTLTSLFGQSPDSDLIVAICYDKYRSNYTRSYLDSHHPLLVLTINGKLRDQWPTSPSGDSLGPYLVSHPMFKPRSSVLSAEDLPEIPYGVIRIEMLRESTVLGTILPPGHWSQDSMVEKGYRIVQRDCFRCHNRGEEGGRMANISWKALADKARDDNTFFQQYIRSPQSFKNHARMPAHAAYDQATLDAISAYFLTFATPVDGRIKK